jgi:hypothetical protein
MGQSEEAGKEEINALILHCPSSASVLRCTQSWRTRKEILKMLRQINIKAVNVPMFLRDESCL